MSEKVKELYRIPFPKHGVFKHQIVTVAVPLGTNDIDVILVPVGKYWLLYKWTARLSVNVSVIPLLDGEEVNPSMGPNVTQVVHPTQIDGAMYNMFPIPAKSTIGGTFTNTGAAANNYFLIWYIECNVGEI